MLIIIEWTHSGLIIFSDYLNFHVKPVDPFGMLHTGSLIEVELIMMNVLFVKKKVIECKWM